MAALEQEIGKPSVLAGERKRVGEKQKHATAYTSSERKELLGFLEKKRWEIKLLNWLSGIKKVVNPGNSLGVTEHKNGPYVRMDFLRSISGLTNA